MGLFAIIFFKLHKARAISAARTVIISTVKNFNPADLWFPPQPPLHNAISMTTVQGVQIGGLRRVNHVKCHGLRRAAWHFEITVISMTIIEGFGKEKRKKIGWGQLKPWFVCAERFAAGRSQVNGSVGFFATSFPSVQPCVKGQHYQPHANCAGWMWKSLKDALKQLPNVFSVQLNARLFAKCTSGSSSLSVCFSLNWPMPASLLLSSFYKKALCEPSLVGDHWPVLKDHCAFKSFYSTQETEKKYQTEEVLSLWTAEEATITERVRISLWT